MFVLGKKDLLSILVVFGILLPIYAAPSTKTGSTLYGAEIVGQVRQNIERYAWAAEVRDGLVEAARPWAERSDEDLWGLVFGPAITRSWMVWSNGYCPACKKQVPMYNWKMNAEDHPWKVQCPHCKALFPTNDFGAFHASGLDEKGFFDPERADRSLLFNTAHPDPVDPQHLFGVDDGEGYREGEKTWRFIGAYLIYGHWKQLIVAGIRTLGAAYVVTGDQVYAHKAAILLDRVADIYPEFDFGKQALVYERKGDRGYVSTWHDACEESREMIMAYDMIFEAMAEDQALVEFLSAKAQQQHLENPKATIADIRANIETGILRDILAHRDKIRTNYPRDDIAIALTLAVLGWPEQREAFYAVVDPMLKRATAVDGVTGEKGMAGYTSYTIQALALFLGECAKVEPDFLPSLLQRHPKLKETWRFFIDMMCLGRYYPQVGDTGSYAIAVDKYVGMNFLRLGYNSSSKSYWSFLSPSCFSLLWRFYEETQDPAYVQIAWQANQSQAKGLPHDLYCADPEAVRNKMAAVIEKEGSALKLESVDKQDWRIAILRSGQGEHARALWLDYDSGGAHSHADGLNLGFFAEGLDLMPEFGYPQVQYGGWNSTRARWYTRTAAHNTVMVDERDTSKGGGSMALWELGERCRVMRATAPALNQGHRYERTAALIDVDETACYVVDCFRVEGGAKHTKFMQSHFGDLAFSGVKPSQVISFNENILMRDCQVDPTPQPGWAAIWRVEDKRGYLPEGKAVQLRYTDFTQGAAVGRGEAWMVFGSFDSTEEMWLPRLLMQRESPAKEPLASTFLGLIEPTATEFPIQTAQRLDLYDAQGALLSDQHAALQIDLCDGRRDLVLLRDPEEASVKALSLKAPPLETDAEIAWIRLNTKGAVERAFLAQGAYLRLAGNTIEVPEGATAFDYLP